MHKTNLIITTTNEISKITNISKESINYFKKNNILKKDKSSIDFYIQDKENIIVLAFIKKNNNLEEIQNTSASFLKQIISLVEKIEIKETSIKLSIDKEAFNEEEIKIIEKGIILAKLAYDDKNIFKKERNPKVSIKIENITNKEINKITSYIHEVRILTSTPANKLTISEFINYCKNLNNYNKDLKIKVLNKKDLEKENMNLHLAVGAGGSQDPALIVMEYTPKNKEKEKPIVLIGKGLIYDSGGLHLKPDGSMWDMYGDMAGAATVAVIMKSLKDLNINKKVIGICGMAENMVDEDSYKNGDIYTSKNGLTVEIGHTDAEGRLVLADCLAYAYEKYDPNLVIDIATLTGGCVIALGEMYSGAFSESKQLIDEFVEIGYKVNDWVWPLPLDQQIKDLLKSDRADLNNISKVPRILSASVGAAFLSYFVKDTEKWIHLDIAGTALRQKMKREYDSPSLIGSGSTYHLLIEFLKNN